MCGQMEDVETEQEWGAAGGVRCGVVVSSAQVHESVVCNAGRGREGPMRYERGVRDGACHMRREACGMLEGEAGDGSVECEA